jgi:RIO kinase 1
MDSGMVHKIVFESDSDNETNRKANSNDIRKLKNVNLDYNINYQKASKRIESEIKNIDRNDYLRSMKRKDKSDRATVEQVLDSRISKIIYKLVNKGDLSEFNGCISTGKEANVYYAKGNGKELAIKIYKTSILIFKDRERYIAGEYRFRHGYCKSNPRKMVAVWAEKEVRNLKRLHQAGIKCPNPILLKSSLIVMEFIGSNGIAAPKLKDASIETIEEWEANYLKMIDLMRILWKKCKLVHADLSEYNILYHE